MTTDHENEEISIQSKKTTDTPNPKNIKIIPPNMRKKSPIDQTPIKINSTEYDNKKSIPALIDDDDDDDEDIDYPPHHSPPQSPNQSEKQPHIPEIYENEGDYYIDENGDMIFNKSQDNDDDINEAEKNMDTISASNVVDEKCGNKKLKDVKVEDEKVDNEKVEDGKVVDEKMKDEKVGDGKVEDEKMEDGKVEDGKGEDGKVGGGKVEDEKMKDEKVEDVKVEDEKVEDEKVGEDVMVKNVVDGKRNILEYLQNEGDGISISEKVSKLTEYQRNDVLSELELNVAEYKKVIPGFEMELNRKDPLEINVARDMKYGKKAKIYKKAAVYKLFLIIAWFVIQCIFEKLGFHDNGYCEIQLELMRYYDPLLVDMIKQDEDKGEGGFFGELTSISPAYKIFLINVGCVMIFGVIFMMVPSEKVQLKGLIKAAISQFGPQQKEIVEKTESGDGGGGIMDMAQNFMPLILPMLQGFVNNRSSSQKEVQTPKTPTKSMRSGRRRYGPKYDS